MKKKQQRFIESKSMIAFAIAMSACEILFSCTKKLLYMLTSGPTTTSRMQPLEVMKAHVALWFAFSLWKKPPQLYTNSCK